VKDHFHWFGRLLMCLCYGLLWILASKLRYDVSYPGEECDDLADQAEINLHLYM
ncbi:hypothetical protein HAX54_010127, partial [Datura stramonium]|nr:hypothetical protein [Datura stramonium]